nr:unnamed protein product [Callosobruchus chinensis]
MQSKEGQFRIIGDPVLTSHFQPLSHRRAITTSYQYNLPNSSKYKTGKFGLNEICILYKIPKPTFKRHLLGKKYEGKGRN